MTVQSAYIILRYPDLGKEIRLSVSQKICFGIIRPVIRKEIEPCSAGLLYPDLSGGRLKSSIKVRVIPTRPLTALRERLLKKFLS